MTTRFQVTPVPNDPLVGETTAATEMNSVEHHRVHVDPTLEQPSPNITESSLPIGFSVPTANTHERTTSDEERHSIAAQGVLNSIIEN
jgi:hypothetical protein